MSQFNENLYYYLNNARVSVSTMKFPGGEVGVNINNVTSLGYDPDRIELVAKIQNSDQLIATFLATDALRRVYPQSRIELFIPYFPYARQDRVCNEGEALSVKVIATLINAHNYNQVVVADPHSPVLVAALDRCHVLEQHVIFAQIGRGSSFVDTIIVAPDAGAVKKAELFAKQVGAKGIVFANKQRNLKTGEITGMELMGTLAKGESLFVIDDICDGGRTFVELARLLKEYEPRSLELAVTHGIFSKGIVVLTADYDRVYTTNSLPQQANDKLTVIPL